MADHLEHLPIGELRRRADGGDRAAAAALEAGRAWCTTTGAALDAMNARSAQMAERFRAQLNAPMKVTMPSTSKPTADAIRRIDMRAALLRRLFSGQEERIPGRTRHRRFVSHSPFRRTR